MVAINLPEAWCHANLIFIVSSVAFKWIKQMYPLNLTNWLPLSPYYEGRGASEDPIIGPCKGGYWRHSTSSADIMCNQLIHNMFELTWVFGIKWKDGNWMHTDKPRKNFFIVFDAVTKPILLLTEKSILWQLTKNCC